MSRIISFFVCALLLAACEKEKNGSNGPGDIADQYAGTYMMTDTSSYTNPQTGQQVTTILQDTVVMNKISASTVSIKGLTVCDSVVAEVTATSATLIDPGSGCAINFSSTRQGDALFYSYARQAMVVVYARGKVVKQ